MHGKTIKWLHSAVLMLRSAPGDYFNLSQRKAYAMHMQMVILGGHIGAQVHHCAALEPFLEVNAHWMSTATEIEVRRHILSC